MSSAFDETNRLKRIHALVALEASIIRVPPFDATKQYSYEEPEVFDALSSRFIRAYESAISYFRSYDLRYSLQQADTLRDLLHNMEKASLISHAAVWFDMRLIRNKITHDYLPEQAAYFFKLILAPFAAEMQLLKKKVNT